MEPMKPIYLPKRRGEETDEDYDTGIMQNEENLNENLRTLHGELQAVRAELDAANSTISSLRALLNGK